MAIVRIRWTDALGLFAQVWTTPDEILENLVSTEVITVGHLVPIPSDEYIVLAVSKTGEGPDATYGGIFCVPALMVTSKEILEPDAGT